MLKRGLFAASLFVLVFVGIACAEADNLNDIVQLDEKTFVMVKYMEANSDKADAVLSLFKVQSDQLILLDEIHYKAAEQLAMRTNLNQSVIKHMKTPN